VREGRHARHDRGVVRVARHRDDERAVDLQLLHGKPPEVGQRRISSPEVVDRQVHAQFAQRLQHANRTIGVGHEHRFGELEPQRVGRQTRACQGGLDRREELASDELAGGEVDRDAQSRELRVFGAPASRLGACEFENARAEPHDQAALLRHANELDGRYGPELRMVPADKGFRRDDASGRDVHERLESDGELVALDRDAQVFLELEAPQGALAKVAVEQLLTAASRVLRLKHGDVRVAQDRLCGVGSRPVYDDDSRAGADREVAAGNQDRLADGLPQLLREGRRLVHGAGTLGDDEEPVTADAADDVAGAYGALKAAGDDTQNAVADTVAERVVDHLEMVEVEEDDGQQGIRALRRLEKLADPVDDDRPAREAGQ